MEIRKTIKNIIHNEGGIAKNSAFVSAGFTNYEVANLHKEGYLERIRHGYYQLAENGELKEEEILSKLLPEAIICVESALFHYGYIDFVPRKWSIAVNRSFSSSRLKFDTLALKVYYIQNHQIDIGKRIGEFQGVKLWMYDSERCIVDCFRYRNKLDNELFNKAVNSYVADGNKNLNNLASYAKEFRVYSKLMNVMEVLFNAR